MTRYICASPAPSRHEMTLLKGMPSFEVSCIPSTACRRKCCTKPFQAYSKYYGAGHVATDERAISIRVFEVP